MWNAHRAYVRRRGWLAWHIAALGRAEKLPSLDALTGRAPARLVDQDPEKLLAFARQWKVALQRKFGKPPEEPQESEGE